jgi:hypothetical protein
MFKQFRENINNLIRSDKPESPTNLCFIVLVLFLAGWETYAVLTKGTVPHVELMLTFILAIKVNKAYNERKAGVTGVATTEQGKTLVP